MNIAVITPYDASNFGAFLQAYALKTHIESLGHRVLHVKHRPERMSRRSFYRVRPCKQDLLQPLDYRRNLSFGREKYALFRRDLATFSTIDPTEMSSADATVLGSDEIWNVRNRVFRDPIFFGHQVRNVIAYAPSVGASTFDDYAGHGEWLEDIRRIRSLSARDNNTAEFLERVTSERPPIVLDPTMLHTWEPECPHVLSDSFEAGYLLVYAYNARHVPIAALRAFAASRGLKLVSVGFRHEWCDESVNCSPLEFPAVVDGARHVFTTTFHGTIFCILRSKAFACRPISPKTVHLLEVLGLDSRQVSAESPQSDVEMVRAFDNAPDYAGAFEIIAQMRTRSQSYLARALGAVEEEQK